MKKQLTILQQNDTHGALELHPELFWSAKGARIKNVGGFSRIKQYIKEVKKEASNVLFFDGGDLFHGSAPLVFSKGRAILPALKKMELDGMVPGNWDFAYGKETIESLTKSLPFETIAANVRNESGSSFFSPFFIKELNGIRVGIIGLTYPYVDQTMPEEFSKGLIFSRGIKEIQESVQEIRGNVDIIILISHMGLPLDVKLASEVKGIDIILSGHSHDRIELPIVQDGTLIIQAGSSSSFIGRLDLTIDQGKVDNYQYRLVPMVEEMQEDEEMREIITDIIKPFHHLKMEIVGATESILHRMTLNEAPMDKLITDSYLHAFNADVAFSHGWRYGTPLPAGQISLFDLYNIIPTNPEMFTLEMDGATLLNALEKNLEQVFSSDPYEQKGGYILRSSGLFLTLKPYNPKGRRIQNCLIRGREISKSQTYKIVGGGKQLFKGMLDQHKQQGVNSIDVIQAYLKEIGTYRNDTIQSIISI